MTQKMPWLISAVAVVVAGGAVTVALTRPPQPSAARKDQEIQELSARLGRLETGASHADRSLAQAGARLSAAALARAAAAPAEDLDSPEAQEKQAAAEAERERRRYDELDTLARSGGGSALAAQLRKNLELGGPGLRQQPKDQPLHLAALDCSEALCRVELRKTEGRVDAIGAMHVLGRGMGTLSMRPAAAGAAPVFYVAAPGRRLPNP